MLETRPLHVTVDYIVGRVYKTLVFSYVFARMRVGIYPMGISTRIKASSVLIQVMVYVRAKEQWPAVILSGTHI